MGKISAVTLCLCAALTLAGCAERSDRADVERALEDLNVVDQTDLNDIMAASVDPREAVAYFRRASDAAPGRIDLKRGLAESLIRAGKPAQAAAIWTQVASSGAAGPADRLALADALIRAGDWDAAEAELTRLPPDSGSFRRIRLDAMVADRHGDWERADGLYRTAVGLTTSPAGTLNNWGFSKLSRGAYAEAERLFAEAITFDGTLYTAKNNLVLARGAQRKYDLPAIGMDQVERAQLLHSLALTAIKQGDVAIGEGLLREAIDTHPRHFEIAARALATLETSALR